MENEFSRREVIAGAGVAATTGIISGLIGTPALLATSKDGNQTFTHGLPPLP